MKKGYLCIGILLVLIIWVLWANTAVEVNEWTMESERLPEAFEGFRIAQVSDLHNTKHWEDAVRMLRKARPNLIVLTGDLIDSRNTDVERALAFAAEAVQIAPCFYDTGNHESRVRAWSDLRQGLLDAGVRVLQDEACIVEKDGAHITILGLMDPDFGGSTALTLERLAAGEGYTILLSHRPELFPLYANYDIDLVFTGHAHGGQVRIPFVGGLIAPHQGWLPEYDAGLFEMDGTSMLVSRGVGNSIAPLRVNNRPEILVAVLHGEGSR